MMHIPHKLTDEFPDETVLITRLTKTNYLFRRALTVTTRSIVRSFASNRKRSSPPTRCSKGSRKSASSLRTRLPACLLGLNAGCRFIRSQLMSAVERITLL